MATLASPRRKPVAPSTPRVAPPAGPTGLPPEPALGPRQAAIRSHALNAPLAAPSLPSTPQPHGGPASPIQMFAADAHAPALSPAEGYFKLNPVQQQPGAPPPGDNAPPGDQSNGNNNNNGGGGGGQAPLDYSSDPVLQEIRRTEQENLNAENSGFDDATRQLLIRSGLKDVAASTLGADSPFLSAITDDPNGVSDASRLNRQYIDKARNLDESLADQGLTFSGARVGQQGDLAHQKIVDRADLASALQAALAGIRDQRVGAQHAYSQAITQGEGEARDRAIALALKYHTGNPGGDDSGGSGGGDTSPNVDPTFGISQDDLLAALARAAATKKNVAV